MDKIAYFRQYVDSVGGAPKAAARLGLSESMVYHILNGVRGITPEVALRVEQDSEGAFSKTILVWGAVA